MRHEIRQRFRFGDMVALRMSYHPNARHSFFSAVAALRLDPKWDSIRSDPRFQQLIGQDEPRD